MPLEQVLALTPRNSSQDDGAGRVGHIDCVGVSMLARTAGTVRAAFDMQHAADELLFAAAHAAVLPGDYTSSVARQRAPHVVLDYNLSAFRPFKEVAIVFRFDAIAEARLQVYTDAALIDAEELRRGDDQFLLEVESTAPLRLYFVHVHRAPFVPGGDWYFRGIDIYVV